MLEKEQQQQVVAVVEEEAVAAPTVVSNGVYERTVGASGVERIHHLASGVSTTLNEAGAGTNRPPAAARS